MRSACAPGVHAGAGLFCDDAACFDPSTLRWHSLVCEGEVPEPRGWLASTACSRGMVIHGGIALNNDRLADMYLLSMHD